MSKLFLTYCNFYRTRDYTRVVPERRFGFVALELALECGNVLSVSVTFDRNTQVSSVTRI